MLSKSTMASNRLVSVLSFQEAYVSLNPIWILNILVQNTNNIANQEINYFRNLWRNFYFEISCLHFIQPLWSPYCSLKLAGKLLSQRFSPCSLSPKLTRLILLLPSRLHMSLSWGAFPHPLDTLHISCTTFLHCAHHCLTCQIFYLFVIVSIQ